MDDGAAPQPPPPQPAAPGPAQPAASPPASPAAEAHEPFLRRMRKAGADPSAFSKRATQRWFTLGVVALAVVALLPLLAPQYAVVTQRLSTLLSLVFLMGAVGLWLGMGGRSFAVSTAFMLLLYALTAWTRFAFPLEDFFVVAVLVSFAIFALAGFNLVFILEEMVYDAHVRIHLRNPAWAALPTLAVLAVAVLLPVWTAHGGPHLPALWTASIVGSVLLLGWWFVRTVNDLGGTGVLRELHLFVVGVMAASALADLAGSLHDLPSIVPSLLAYLVLLGTWVYVSYTTLQRTHFLLAGRNAQPWVALLLGASYAILAHAQVLFQEAGTRAVADLTRQRSGYFIFGVWTGIAFYVAHGGWRVLRYVRDARGLGARSRHLAGKAAVVAGSLAETEHYIQQAAEAMFRGFDQVLPGAQQPPRKVAGWELDPDAPLRPLEPKP